MEEAVVGVCSGLWGDVRLLLLPPLETEEGIRPLQAQNERGRNRSPPPSIPRTEVLRGGSWTTLVGEYGTGSPGMRPSSARRYCPCGGTRAEAGGGACMKRSKYKGGQGLKVRSPFGDSVRGQ